MTISLFGALIGVRSDPTLDRRLSIRWPSAHLIGDRLELAAGIPDIRRALYPASKRSTEYHPFPVIPTARVAHGLPAQDKQLWLWNSECVRVVRIWQTRQIALLICMDSMWTGGLLLHSALASRSEDGVVFAGHSGAGKTTASRRLVPPWESLSDDTTLVVQDRCGRFWAHPWPSASDYFDEIPTRIDVRRFVPLEAVFYLEHSSSDAVTRIGQGEATCNLVDSVSQALSVFPHGQPSNEIMRLFRARVFENACSLVKSVPVYKLRLTLTGRFWELIEQVLEDQCQPANPR